jgi:hypothetical protein
MQRAVSQPAGPRRINRVRQLLDDVHRHRERRRGQMRSATSSVSAVMLPRRMRRRALEARVDDGDDRRIGRDNEARRRKDSASRATSSGTRSSLNALTAISRSRCGS